MARIILSNSNTLDYNSAEIDEGFIPVESYAQQTQIVAADILDKFGIDTAGSLPPRGKVEGFDIYNMDAAAALRLSLAENFIDSALYEVHVNPLGQAEWINVGSRTWNPTNSTCPMFSVPTYSPRLQGELVVVRGFDRPPIRFTADSSPKNRTISPLGMTGTHRPIIVQPIDTSDPSNVTSAIGGASEFGDNPSYAGSILNKHAGIIYYEPVLDSAYKDDIKDAYNPRCFESLIAWKYRIKYSLLEGLDKDAQVEFSNTATVGLPLVWRSTTNTDPPEMLLEVDTTLIRNAIVRRNPYGEPYSSFQEVNSVLVYGYQVSNIAATANPGGAGIVTFLCERSPGDSDNAGTMLFQLGQGSDWYWSYDSPSNPGTNPGEISVKIRQSPEAINNYPASGNFTPRIHWGPAGTGGFDESLAGLNAHWLPLGQGFGYIAAGLFCNVVLNVPCINVYSPKGKAKQIAQTLVGNEFFTLAPIVLFDPPAPIYYRFRSGLDISPSDYPRDGASGFIDQAEDLVDADPTTRQDLSNTDSKKLQNLTNGFTVDVSLPFVKGGKITHSVASDCLASEVNPTESEEDIKNVRDFLFNLYNDESINKQYSFSAGIIENLPTLGDSYEDGIINSISYSYQDGSSFTASVSVGPKLLNSGSWGTSIYRKQTEDISREGTVVQVAGDNSTFAVKVWRLGVYSAISAIREEIEVGDRVSVTIYNNPVEL